MIYRGFGSMVYIHRDLIESKKFIHSDLLNNIQQLLEKFAEHYGVSILEIQKKGNRYQENILITIFIYIAVIYGD